jgi:deoxyribonuclease (pyrimidine dimer)
MTRVNIGVDPSELCDQHLVAEYRETPRLWGLESRQKPPERFKLGKGHVLFCAQYQGTLADRYTVLVMEMRRRGFKVTYPDPPQGAIGGRRMSEDAIREARQIVMERLREKYATMRRKPRWTVADGRQGV